MVSNVPYEAIGRTAQKSRTREALVDAARALLVQGDTPTVETAAKAASISRTTAYRYFSNQRALIAAALPEVGSDSLLPADPPAQVAARLDLVVRAAIAFAIEWEPLLRASLRLSLEPSVEQPPLRGGRAIAWYLDALEPLRRENPEVDRRRLAIAIRSATGIESLVWLIDVAGLNREEAADMMLASARALFRAAVTDPVP
ncbi:MAG: TetR/AcrR family transcriptional regulator [Candidatus Nanopelagicales bacterium]|jgi:AcrR family transcriptional regulator|nr:TetR/AcrR family transcriptional regulator [Candidatus Nanopelagicales bacterium]